MGLQADATRRDATNARSTESSKSADQSIELHSNWQTGSVDVANDDDDDQDGERLSECRQQFQRQASEARYISKK